MNFDCNKIDYDLAYESDKLNKIYPKLRLDRSKKSKKKKEKLFSFGKTYSDFVKHQKVQELRKKESV